MSASASVGFADLYHTGIIVDEVEAAKAEYSDLMGVTWGAQGSVEMPILLPDGPKMVTFEYAYTTAGPHRLELVAPIPGTLWAVHGNGHAHHLGYWCGDVAATSAELARRGHPLRVKVGVSEPDEPAGIVIHQARSGVYIELVDVALRSAMFPGDE
jgi:Glyoxalase/Bleomycin resistance protein/Dioxygenase superfamily